MAILSASRASAQMRRVQYQRRRAERTDCEAKTTYFGVTLIHLSSSPMRCSVDEITHSQLYRSGKSTEATKTRQKPERESERKAMATKLEHYNSFRVAARTSDSKRCTVSGASWLKELFIDFLYSQFFFARILNFAPPTTYTPLHRLLDSIDSNLQYRLSQPISYSLRSNLISPNSTSSLQIAQLSRLIRPTQLDRRVQT